MERTARLPWLPLPTVGDLAAAWRRAWHRFTMDADERYLYCAGDLGDLERRLKQVERGRSERYRCHDAGY